MDLEKYGEISISSDVLEYRFVSVGRNGNIPKIVQFTKIGANIYNLAFGDEGEMAF